ncbi:hypothetical protein [Mycolicibacterium sp. NCC-Tsukiji]|uniref:hypothetical protein n=1 Tax=Mycobacteriaceae TaxID=1762 RepID=UPI000EC66637|nr:hypothetical protein [Mycolicibacterium sp. NCC-Tsukiji]GCB01558.1 hypothetical protein NCCNTM_51920 [Mycolicibacterium sp. NCC-Tsukiji]
MPRIRLRTQILILQMVIVTASLAAGFGIIIHRTDTQTRTEFARRAQAIAETVASDQEVQAGAAAQSAARRAGHPASAAELAAAPLQRQAAAITARTGVLFVVIADNAGYRIAHPDATQLDRPLSTDPSAVRGGKSELTVQQGTLGDSVRAKAPIRGPDGTVVGLVSVGVAMDTVNQATHRTLVLMVTLVAIALTVGGIGSALLTRRWRRLTLSLEPEEMAELIREQDAVLHSGAEGVIAIDADGIARVINERARELLGITAEPGTPLGDLGLTPRVAAVAAEPTTVPVAAAVNERVVLVSSRRVHRDGTDLGTVLTAVDRTDIEALTPGTGLGAGNELGVAGTAPRVGEPSARGGRPAPRRPDRRGAELPGRDHRASRRRPRAGSGTPRRAASTGIRRGEGGPCTRARRRAASGRRDGAGRYARAPGGHHDGGRESPRQRDRRGGRELSAGRARPGSRAGSAARRT